MEWKFPPSLVSAHDLPTALSQFFGGPVFIDIESFNRIVVNRVDKLIASVRSDYQQIDIFDTPHFGRVLSLDGRLQVAEADERIYHEFLIHPACLVMPRLQSALLLGAGDGCAARELLKYRTVDRIDLIEIDALVVDLCREHFTHVNEGALEDPRVTVDIADAWDFLHNAPPTSYDLIVADLTEPYDPAGSGGDLSHKLFSEEFFGLLGRRLQPGGILSIQTGGLTFLRDVDQFHWPILRSLHAGFASVSSAYFYIHSFDQLWSASFASRSDYGLPTFDPTNALADRNPTPLIHYDAEAHRRIFERPRKAREHIKP